MDYFDSWYRRGQHAALRRPYRVMAFAALLFGTAAAGLGRTTLDLSFRPLFASGEEIAAPTRDFEAVFGQSSGAWVLAIVEAQDLPSAVLLRALAEMSDAAAQIEGVREVLSLTEVSLPQWHDGRLSFVEPIPRWLLQPGEEMELDEQYRDLLSGSRFVGWLVSADGSRLLLGARIALPLADLDGRRRIVREFERRLVSAAPAGALLHFSGVSIVELAYESQILMDQGIATAATSVVLALLLLCCFGSPRAVIVCLLPVTVAVPATLGLMGWLGQPVTIINTVIPALVMVIGVADAVHMLTAWLRARRLGLCVDGATRRMLHATGRACFLTTITTMAGFLALLSASLDSVGAFGLCAALGILLAWLANQLLLPFLLLRMDIGVTSRRTLADRLAENALAASLRWALGRPRLIATGAALAILACGAMIPALTIDQRFNEELPAGHPVSLAQAALERDFGGFLGPDISISRVDGASMLDEETAERLEHFVAELRQLPQTSRAWSVRDLLPRQHRPADRAAIVQALHEHPRSAFQVQELVAADQAQLAVLVRTTDIGSREAARYREQIDRLIESSWSDDYDVQVVGQWWLAQFGMSLLLKDMLTSVATASLLVLPVLWLVIGDRRLRLAALAANLLPLLLPLAFMAGSGISLRIGTVVVMALSLGLVVDNTLHLVLRFGDRDEGDDLRLRLQSALQDSGRAVLFTTLALVGAFLSMLCNDLQAIRDMGLVAAVTFSGALLADLLVLPALYVLLERDGGTLVASRLSRRSARRSHSSGN